MRNMSLQKLSRSRLACISACRWCLTTGNVFCGMRFVISSGPGAFYGIVDCFPYLPNYDLAFLRVYRVVDIGEVR